MALDITIGGASSDSYGTLAAYQAYGALQGWTLGATDAADEISLRRSVQVIDRDNSFVGNAQYQAQALAWPRVTSVYVDGWPINIDTIPQDIINAQFEMAYLIQNGADPFATVTATVSRTKAKAGPVETETEYLGGLSTPRYKALDGLLAPYITSGAGQRAVVRG